MPPPQGGAGRDQLRLPTIAARGGITSATTLIAIAAGVENRRTTNQASTMSVRHDPISTKYSRLRGIRSIVGADPIDPMPRRARGVYFALTVAKPKL